MLRRISTFVGSNILRHRNAVSISTRLRASSSSTSTAVATAPSGPLSSGSAISTNRSVGPSATVVNTEDGKTWAMLDTRKQPKLKPSIVRNRLAKMRTYVGSEKNIRHSPWRLNLICQMVAGLPLLEAFNQLEFCEKSRAPLVQKVLKRTANLADIRDGLQPSQLEVAECFSTKGRPLKRIKPMARGRAGKMTREHSHMRVVLREIDFKLRVYQQRAINQKKKWLQLQMLAETEAEVAMAERREVQRLEEEQRKVKEKQEQEGRK